MNDIFRSFDLKNTDSINANKSFMINDLKSGFSSSEYIIDKTQSLKCDIKEQTHFVYKFTSSVEFALSIHAETDFDIEFLVEKYLDVKVYIFANHHNNVNIKINTNVEEESKIDIVILDASVKTVVYDMNINLLGLRSTGNLFTSVAAINNANITFNSRINHLNQFTQSMNKNRSIVKKTGNVKYYTVGYIQKGMGQAKCFQDSKVLLLDEQAKAQCDPILLIDEYDVEAGHAAAIGQIDLDELYYLQSRGLTYPQCVSLLVYGFLTSVFEEIVNEEIREFFANQITKSLEV